MKPIFLFAACMAATVYAQAQVTLLPAGAQWKYHDLGVDLGTVWQQPAYSDASWAMGSAELGYGDGDENTTVSYGPDASNKHITTYFRKTIFIPSVSAYTSIQLELVRDDGAVIYVNGHEVVRSNMALGAVTYNTVADGTIAWPSEDDWHTYTISPLHLVSGNNVIAVEVHQDEGSSSDISFNLKMVGLTAPIVAQVTRGPYLQQANDNSIIVKWRTDVACDSKIDFGASVTTLTNAATDPGFTTDHEVHISGLNPYTNYYYAVGHSSAQLLPASPVRHFLTAPVTGTVSKYRFWVVGDAGTGNANMRTVRNSFTFYNQSQPIDGWLWLGDNAYESGFDGNYQDNVFANDTYEELLQNIVVWPAVGNHDYNNHIPFSPSPAYFNIFSLPAGGECGGLASGTEKYYSYNYGNIHFVVLDSYDEDRSSTAAMATWLASDLSANALPWVIAYWHHPPYTKGSHNSDNTMFLDGELVDMRENILPILENYGVDLVLNGHSHSYERSKLVDGHYGYSSSFNATHLIDGSSGNYETECPYNKNTLTTASHKGTVYAVVGCSGKLSGTSSGWPHPVMSSYTENDLGSMLIEVENNRLDAKFITGDSLVFDKFTILKNAGKNTVVEACPGDQLVLHPSWPGNYVWQPMGTTTDSLTVTASLNTLYVVTDPLNCIKDTFDITVLPSPPCIITGVTSNSQAEPHDRLFLSTANQLITTFEDLQGAKKAGLYVYDAGGRIVYTEAFETRAGFNHRQTDLNMLGTGFYIVSLNVGTRSRQQKIVITH